MANQLLRLPDVMKRLGLSRSGVYALAAAGLLARPFKIGARASAWLESDVDDFVAARVEARSASGAPRISKAPQADGGHRHA